MENEEAKCPSSRSPQTMGEVDAHRHWERQVCSHKLGLDSVILPGRSDPSAEISRTRSGKSIPAEGIACSKALRWVKEQYAQGTEGRQILSRLLDPPHLPSYHLSTWRKDGA